MHNSHVNGWPRRLALSEMIKMHFILLVREGSPGQNCGTSLREKKKIVIFALERLACRETLIIIC